MSRVLFIDTIDFEKYPPGGTLNFSRQMLGTFGNRLCLVGVATDDTPVGKWVKKTINGVTYDFFAMGRRQPFASRPLIPPRLTGYFQLTLYKKEILSLGVTSAFIQIHEVLMAAGSWGWKNLCFRFPGVENPLNISRYPGAKCLSGLFDRLFFPALDHADLILAAADEDSIRGLVRRSKGRLTPERIVSFPTRVNTSIFYPETKTELKANYGFPPDATLIVASGRIHWAKGWKLLLDAFEVFTRKCPNTHLCFVGDGQDRYKLQQYAAKLGLHDRVRVTGFKTPVEVASYLQAADLYVMGSFTEGWATVLVEALACGLPIVSTNVSSARAIITEGQNGYVVESRDPSEFSDAMRHAMELENTVDHSVAMTQKYALHSLGNDLGKLFLPLKA